MTAAMHESWTAALGVAPAAARGRIRDLVSAENAASFLDFALTAAEADAAAGRPGSATSVLLETGVAIQVITSPDLCPLEQAVQLAAAFARLDGTIDARILHAISGSAETGRIMRALELIEVISDCRRLLIPLMKFARVSDEKVRSKTIKLMARASQNGAWMDSILADRNPRVRANLVEGLCAQMGKAAEPLLRRAVKDPHHRVCTTALMCLAQLGDAASRVALEELTGDGRELHARAANWALEKLKPADPASTAPHPAA